MKTALYPRVSTHGQAKDGDSLDEQVEKMLKYCDLRGFKDIVIYREEGYSAKDTNRPEFKRMMTDTKNGNIQAVIVKKLDRLSRSIVDFEHTFKIFEQYNVDLISLQENFDTTNAAGRAALRVILVFAQMERELISERTRDVMQHRALQGYFNGGYPRLGFDLVDNRLVINKAEELIVKEIFKSYLQKGSLSKTASEMNNKGYRMKIWITQKSESRGGREFSKSNLTRILRDPMYIGKLKYKAQIFDGSHDAVVDEDTFNAVQSMLKANIVTKTGFRESGNKFLLRGLIFCGACRSAMSPSFTLSKGKEYHYYRCTSGTDNSKEKCYIGSVNAKHLEELVIDELKSITEHREIINGVVKQALDEQSCEMEDLKGHKKVLKEHLAQTDKKLKNLMDILEARGTKATNLTAILEEIETLRENRLQLEQLIETVNIEINFAEQDIYSAELINENLIVFRNIFDNLTLDEKYDLLHLFIKRLVYYEDKDQGPDGSKSGKMKMELFELQELLREAKVLWRVASSTPFLHSFLNRVKHKIQSIVGQ